MEYAIGTLTLCIRVEHSRSLKDKRQVIRSLRDRTKRRHNVSIAEVAHQQSWQESTVVVITVATTAGQARQTLDAVHHDAVQLLGRDLYETDLDVSSC